MAQASRKIIHVDCDCFYAAVEMRDDPTLRHRPVAVGGDPNRRGVIATCNYPARHFGVHSAMASSQALRLCPELVIVPPNFDKYRKVSTQIHDIFRRYTRDFLDPRLFSCQCTCYRVGINVQQERMDCFGAGLQAAVKFRFCCFQFGRAPGFGGNQAVRCLRCCAVCPGVLAPLLISDKVWKQAAPLIANHKGLATDPVRHQATLYWTKYRDGGSCSGYQPAPAPSVPRRTPC